MDYLTAALGAANSAIAFGWDAVATTERIPLFVSLGGALLVAAACTMALSPFPPLLRFCIAIIMFLFAFAGAVTLVELAPVLFDPEGLIRSQVTTESIN